MRQGSVSGSAYRTPQPIRVVITDDHPIFRKGIHCTLGCAPNIEVVGESSNVMYAVSLARRTQPDVVVVGINLHAMPGLEIARAIKAQLPSTSLVLMTDEDKEHYLIQAVAVGASAIFSKSVSPQEFLEGLRAVASGKNLITPYLTRRYLVTSPLSVADQSTACSPTRQASSPAIGLAPRQLEVLEHIAVGYSNKEIARALNISSQTVKHHITAIMRRLGVKDRTEAVVHALQRGWLQIGDASPRSNGLAQRAEEVADGETVRR